MYYTMLHDTAIAENYENYANAEQLEKSAIISDIFLPK